MRTEKTLDSHPQAGEELSEDSAMPAVRKYLDAYIASGQTHDRAELGRTILARMKLQ